MEYNPGKLELRNFYENSFKQLSDVQQRQVGLIVGAAVGDAAARPLEGYSAEEAAEWQRAASEGADEAVPLAFAHGLARRGHRSASAAAPPADLLLAHSFTYALQADLVRTMARARGDFPVSEVEPLWVRTASGVDAAAVLGAEQGSLLHALGTVLPLPAVYPYASDAALREFAAPFVSLLTEGALAEEAAVVADCTLSVLGVALRLMQRNPDAVRNSALQALPGVAPVFPPELRALCPATPQSLERWTVCARQSVLPARPIASDAAVVSESLHIARTASSFARGVGAAIAAGGPVCQRALLVGGLLGARLGVRQIPPEWVSATMDHKTVSTFAIDVAQWAWNPPHH